MSLMASNDSSFSKAKPCQRKSQRTTEIDPNVDMTKQRKVKYSNLPKCKKTKKAGGDGIIMNATGLRTHLSQSFKTKAETLNTISPSRRFKIRKLQKRRHRLPVSQSPIQQSWISSTTEKDYDKMLRNKSLDNVLNSDLVPVSISRTRYASDSVVLTGQKKLVSVTANNNSPDSSVATVRTFLVPKCSDIKSTVGSTDSIKPHVSAKCLRNRKRQLSLEKKRLCDVQKNSKKPKISSCTGDIEKRFFVHLDDYETTGSSVNQKLQKMANSMLKIPPQKSKKITLKNNRLKIAKKSVESIARLHYSKTNVENTITQTKCVANYDVFLKHTGKLLLKDNNLLDNPLNIVHRDNDNLDEKTDSYVSMIRRDGSVAKPKSHEIKQRNGEKAISSSETSTTSICAENGNVQMECSIENYDVESLESELNYKHVISDRSQITPQLDIDSQKSLFQRKPFSGSSVTDHWKHGALKKSCSESPRELLAEDVHLESVNKFKKAKKRKQVSSKSKPQQEIPGNVHPESIKKSENAKHRQNQKPVAHNKSSAKKLFGSKLFSASEIQQNLISSEPIIALDIQTSLTQPIENISTDEPQHKSDRLMLDCSAGDQGKELCETENTEFFKTSMDELVSEIESCRDDIQFIPDQASLNYVNDAEKDIGMDTPTGNMSDCSENLLKETIGTDDDWMHSSSKSLELEEGRMLPLEVVITGTENNEISSEYQLETSKCEDDYVGRCNQKFSSFVIPDFKAASIKYQQNKILLNSYIKKRIDIEQQMLSDSDDEDIEVPAVYKKGMLVDPTFCNRLLGTSNNAVASDGYDEVQNVCEKADTDTESNESIFVSSETESGSEYEEVVKQNVCNKKLHKTEETTDTDIENNETIFESSETESGSESEHNEKSEIVVKQYVQTGAPQLESSLDSCCREYDPVMESCSTPENMFDAEITDDDTEIANIRNGMCISAPLLLDTYDNVSDVEDDQQEACKEDNTLVSTTKQNTSILSLKYISPIKDTDTEVISQLDRPLKAGDAETLSLKIHRIKKFLSELKQSFTRDFESTVQQTHFQENNSIANIPQRRDCIELQHVKSDIVPRSSSVPLDCEIEKSVNLLQRKPFPQFVHDRLQLECSGKAVDEQISDVDHLKVAHKLQLDVNKNVNGSKQTKLHGNKQSTGLSDDTQKSVGVFGSLSTTESSMSVHYIDDRQTVEDRQIKVSGCENQPMNRTMIDEQQSGTNFVLDEQTCQNQNIPSLPCDTVENTEEITPTTKVSAHAITCGSRVDYNVAEQDSNQLSAVQTCENLKKNSPPQNTNSQLDCNISQHPPLNRSNKQLDSNIPQHIPVIRSNTQLASNISQHLPVIRSKTQLAGNISQHVPLNRSNTQLASNIPQHLPLNMSKTQLDSDITQHPPVNRLNIQSDNNTPQNPHLNRSNTQLDSNKPQHQPLNRSNTPPDNNTPQHQPLNGSSPQLASNTPQHPPLNRSNTQLDCNSPQHPPVNRSDNNTTQQKVLQKTPKTSIQSFENIPGLKVVHNKILNDGRTVASYGTVLPQYFKDLHKKCVACEQCHILFNPVDFLLHVHPSSLHPMLHADSLENDYVPCLQLDSDRKIWEIFLYMKKEELIKKCKQIEEEEEAATTSSLLLTSVGSTSQASLLKTNSSCIVTTTGTPLSQNTPFQSKSVQEQRLVQNSTKVPCQQLFQLPEHENGDNFQSITSMPLTKDSSYPNRQQHNFENLSACPMTNIQPLYAFSQHSTSYPHRQQDIDNSPSCEMSFTGPACAFSHIQRVQNITGSLGGNLDFQSNPHFLPQSTNGLTTVSDQGLQTGQNVTNVNTSRISPITSSGLTKPLISKSTFQKLQPAPITSCVAFQVPGSGTLLTADQLFPITCTSPSSYKSVVSISADQLQSLLDTSQITQTEQSKNFQTLQNVQQPNTPNVHCGQHQQIDEFAQEQDTQNVQTIQTSQQKNLLNTNSIQKPHISTVTISSLPKKSSRLLALLLQDDNIPTRNIKLVTAATQHDQSTLSNFSSDRNLERNPVSNLNLYGRTLEQTATADYVVTKCSADCTLLPFQHSTMPSYIPESQKSNPPLYGSEVSISIPGSHFVRSKNSANYGLTQVLDTQRETISDSAVTHAGDEVSNNEQSEMMPSIEIEEPCTFPALSLIQKPSGALRAFKIGQKLQIDSLAVMMKLITKDEELVKKLEEEVKHEKKERDKLAKQLSTIEAAVKNMSTCSSKGK